MPKDLTKTKGISKKNVSPPKQKKLQKSTKNRAREPKMEPGRTKSGAKIEKMR